MVPDTTTGDHPMPKINDAALAAFIARKAEIDAALKLSERVITYFTSGPLRD